MTAASYLVIDDDEPFRARISKALRARGNTTYDTGSPEESLRLATEYQPHRIILDLRLPGASGLSLLTSLKQASEKSEVLMLTGYGSIATALEAVKRGAVHYLTKPADLEQILRSFAPNQPESKVPGKTPSLSRVEWEHIERVMNDCEGNVTKAAKLLGLHRRSLQRKLKMIPPR